MTGFGIRRSAGACLPFVDGPRAHQDAGMTDEIDPRDADGSDELEAEILQADHAFGSGLFGTTAEEARAGEGLDRALARERPDAPATDETLEVVDGGLEDDENELVGEAVRRRDEFAAPEEAALTIRDEAPGATDHDDRHPADGTEP
jgi:hypothetical protein